MKKDILLAEITDEYSAKILSWAIKKTGSRLEGGRPSTRSISTDF